MVDPLRKLDEYIPQGPARAVWPEIGDFARSLVRECIGKTPYEPSMLIYVLAGHIAWCVRTAGLELDRSVILHPDVIEESILARGKGLSTGTVGNWRSLLYAMARHLLGPGVIPPRLSVIQQPHPTAPHSAEEIVQLRNWADGQSTETRCHDANVFISTGFGAGLKDFELRDLRVGDVTIDSDGVVLYIRGPQERAVPVLSDWEGRFQEFIDYLGHPERYLFRPNRARNGRLVSASFVTQTNGIAPRTNLQKMRATWIVRHLTARTPLQGLQIAAGVTSLESFSRYIRFVPELEADEFRKMLRDAR